MDFLTKKQKKNEGQVPQYYVEGNHEAIITPEQFEQVQAELHKRSKGKYSGINKLLEDRDAVVAALEETIPALCGSEELIGEQAKLSDEMGVLVEMTQNAVAENARIAMDQTEYKKRYDGLVERYEAVEAKYKAVTEQIADNKAKCEILTRFLEALKKVDAAVTEFDPVLWSSTVEEIVVKGKKDIVIRFKGDMDIQL